MAITEKELEDLKKLIYANMDSQDIRLKKKIESLVEILRKKNIITVDEADKIIFPDS